MAKRARPDARERSLSAILSLRVEARAAQDGALVTLELAVRYEAPSGSRQPPPREQIGERTAPSFQTP
jgi:hypothetical protein